MGLSAIISYGAQATVSMFAFWRGGMPERVAGALLAIAAIASLLIPYDRATAYHGVYWPLLKVDAALLAALVALALVADRFWPLWLAGMQAVAVATHGVRQYESDVVAVAYWLIEGKIAYGMMAALAIGTWRHRCRSLRGANEFGWSFQRRRSRSLEQAFDRNRTAIRD